MKRCVFWRRRRPVSRIESIYVDPSDIPLGTLEPVNFRPNA